ncbi:phosphotransferase [soil metagenome]
MSALADLLREWLPEQRWFGGKGRTLSTVELDSFPLGGDPQIELYRARIGYADGGFETYLVPLTRRDWYDGGLARALVGEMDDPPRFVYDAMRDRHVTRVWIDLFAEGRDRDGLRFVVEPEVALPLETPGDIISTEQSNSSLIFGETAILKLFRRLESGRNPDVEIHDALREQKNPHVAALLGFVSLTDGDEESTVAMLQTFLPAASDGWSLATASVRDLYAEGDLHPEEVGGDFAGESYRLGEATAAVHVDLAAVLPTATMQPAELGGVVAGMNARLDAALDVVPDLHPHADGLRSRFAELAELAEPIPVQRVHGDFHLGRVLRTYLGWTILDFEGEPARPLADRRALDSPLRDIAGMLRSFEYAAKRLLVEGHSDPQLDYRAKEWAARNRTAFCDGYAHASGSDPQAQPVLLHAFEADKAVYEAVYEARNRPHWLPIPLASLARLAAA